MREARDWAGETARMGPILKTRETLEIRERPETGPGRLPGWALYCRIGRN